MLLKFTIWCICSESSFAFKIISEGRRGRLLDCMLSIQRNTLLSSSVNLQTEALTFLCLCLQTLGQITFAHNFPLHTDFATAAQGPDMGQCRPGVSRKVPTPRPKSAAPLNGHWATAIPVLLLLLMVYFRHDGLYHANTNLLINVVM